DLKIGVYEEQLRLQQAELKQLQAQINPHFLYNTYFILYRLAKLQDNESIAQFSQYLGEYFQYITRNGVDNVSLEMEFRHAQTYAQIQNIRFKNRIRVEFEELREPYRSILVPQLILQPLLENAYMHGLEARRKAGLIRVAVGEENGMIRITVEDNGDKLTDEKLASLQASLLVQGAEHEYTGLLNVNRRLQLRFGSEYGVHVRRGELGGLSVTLSMRAQANVATGQSVEGGEGHVQIADRG
ncbi:MAG: histidine kinase, partial [Cohnella sp.]|nr:histidine kinase [Cohnella sp.]